VRWPPPSWRRPRRRPSRELRPPRRKAATSSSPRSVAQNAWSTSLSGKNLTDAGVSSIVGLAQATTGLRLDYSGPYVQPTIRGVGSPLVGPGLNSNIAIYVDGFYVPNPLGSDFQLMSVQGVQILKGPQGTLFGRNATGGAILINTLEPSFEPTVTARVSYSSFDKLNLSGYASTGISDTLAFDVTAFYERGDGYINNINTGKRVSQYNKWTVRPKLLFKPNDDVSITLAYQHAKVDDPSAFLTSAYDGLTAATYQAPDVAVPTGSRETGNDGPANSTLNSDLVTLTGKFDLGFGTFASYTQYRDDKSNLEGDYDSTAAPIMAPDWRVWDKTFTQEFNLSSATGGRFNWVLGLYYYQNSNEYPGYNVSLGGAPKFEFFRSKTKSKSYAAFADATWEATDGLFLTGGLRYSIDKVRGRFLCSACGGLSGDGEETFKKLTPRVNVRYEVGPSANVYASYNKGYKAGFIPVSAFTTVPIKPEQIDAFEVGFKTSNGPLRLDLSTFYYVYKDLQVAAYVNSAALYRNAEKSEIYGLDGQLSYDLTDDFTIGVGATYTHARYKKFGNAVDYVQDTDPTSPSYGLFLHPDVLVDGNVMPRSPSFTGNLSADYKIPLNSGANIALNANFYYTTKFYFDSPKRFVQGSYELLNLRATYTTPNERWAFSVFGNNVTGTKYRIQVLPGDFAIQQVFGEPASIGGSVTLKY
jgi:iron complex outermembrane receptor protein